MWSWLTPNRGLAFNAATWLLVAFFNLDVVLWDRPLLAMLTTALSSFALGFTAVVASYDWARNAGEGG